MLLMYAIRLLIYYTCTFLYPTVLRKFLRYVTGSQYIPPVGYELGSVKVKFFPRMEGIAASTCLLELHMPEHFHSYEELKAILNAVVADVGKSFNCV